MALDTTIGGSAADSYATLAEYQAYATAMGWTLSGDDAADEINLRRAAVMNDASYYWVGYRASETQALQWPRDYAGTVDGYSFDNDEIPQPVKNAQMEMAYLVQGGANPFASAAGGTVIRLREKVDVIEKETQYAESSGAGATTFPGVDRMLRGYTSGKVGQRALSVPIMRA